MQKLLHELGIQAEVLRTGNVQTNPTKPQNPHQKSKQTSKRQIDPIIIKKKVKTEQKN